MGAVMENPYEFIRSASEILKKKRNDKLDALFQEYMDAQEPDKKFFAMEKFIIVKMRMN